jgi:hypothetical protein
MKRMLAQTVPLPLPVFHVNIGQSVDQCTTD